MVKNTPANAGDAGDGFDPWLRGSPAGGSGSLLQYSCLGKPMDRGAWWATVHGIKKSWRLTEQLSTHTHRYV